MKRGPKAGVTTTDAVETIKKAWGDNAPEWLFWLAEECNRTSQTVTADKIGCSGTYVSTLINNKFKGDLSTLEKAVRGALRSETVECPGLHQEILGNDCLDWQKRARKLSTASPLSISMYRACRGGCPHSRLKGSDHVER